MAKAKPKITTPKGSAAAIKMPIPTAIVIAKPVKTKAAKGMKKC